MDAVDYKPTNTEESVRKAWRQAFLIAAPIFIILSILYFVTIESLVSTWIRSQTFVHGFFILPITIFLIWRHRALLKTMTPVPTWWPILPITILAFVWFVSSRVDVLVIQQFSFVLILICISWGILGNRIAWEIKFPLAFLLFMVPAGEAIVPALMEVTASGTVWLIKLSGIPVYREGMEISLPTGRWSVVAACSGIRYLIASFTLGCLYAYLMFNSWKRKLLFVLTSLVVPILANSVRAYLLVLIGHLTHMKVGVGDEHLVYGWVFFGVVIFLLFWIGNRFSDIDSPESSSVAKLDFTRCGVVGLERDIQTKEKVLIWVAIVLAFSFAPLLANIHEIDNSRFSETVLEVPDELPGFRKENSSYANWRPKIVGADRTLERAYVGKDDIYMVQVYQFLNPHQRGGEAVSSNNRYIENGSGWKIISNDRRDILVSGQSITVDEVVVKRGFDSWRVWKLFRIGTYYTGNSYIAKMLEAVNSLFSGRGDAALVFVSVAQDPMFEPSKSGDLQVFLDSVSGAIESGLDSGVLEVKSE